MTTSKRGLRLGICGVALGAAYLGLTASATAGDEPLWVRHLGSQAQDWVTGIAGGPGVIYLSGYTGGSLAGPNRGNTDAWAAKYSAAGQMLEKRQSGTREFDAATGIATDAGGNVYLIGYAGIEHGGGGDDASRWLAKSDAAGHALWLRRVEATVGDPLAVATDRPGNVYVAGTRQGDASLAKYDPSGRVLWSQQLATKREDAATGIATDAAGNVYLTGYIQEPRGGPTRDVWVAKCNASGRVLWRRPLSTEAFDDSAGVATDVAGNVYVAGSTLGSLGGPKLGAADAWLVKYGAAGNVLWKLQVGIKVDDTADGVASDRAGNVYLAGGTRGSFGSANRGGNDAWVAKYDAAGRAAWKRQLGTNQPDGATGVVINAGSVYVTGITYGGLGGAHLGDADVWLAKYSTQP